MALAVKFEKYYELTETISLEDVKKYFEELISISSSEISSEEKLELLRALDEIADKQWHTYTTIASDLKEAVSKCVVGIWDSGSIESTELVVSIVGKLGLREVFSMLRSSLDTELPEDVRNEINDAVDELEENIDDPYSGMRKQ